FAVVGHGLERGQRRAERLAPRRDFGFVLSQMFVAAGLRDAEPSDYRRQPKPQSYQRDENDAERNEQNEVTIWKPFAVWKREWQRQCGGQRDRAAHSGERKHEHPLPRRRRIALAQAPAP